LNRKLENHKSGKAEISSLNRVAKNTGILYARMALTVFISLYATRLTLNALGVEDYGIFNVVAGSIAMLTFLSSALASATQRFISYAEGAGDREKVKVIFNVSVVLHIIIAIIVVLILEVVGYWLFKDILKIPATRVDAAQTVYQLMIVSTLLTIISVPYDAVTNAHENMAFIAVIGVLEALLKLGIAIYITHTDFDRLVIYGFLTVITIILLLFVRQIYCRRRYEECVIRLPQYYSATVLREMAGFAGWNLLGASASMLSSYGQGPLLNSFFGPTVNTAQAISNQVSGQLSTFATTMLKALNPTIAKSEGGGNRVMMLRASLSGVKFSFFLLLLFYIPVFLEMPFIFNLWLKEVPDYAIIFCRLLLLRNLIEQLGIPLITSIHAAGKIKNFQITNSLIWIIPLPVSYYLFALGFSPKSLYYVFGSISLVRVAYIIKYMSNNVNMSLQDYTKKVLFRCLSCLTVSTILATLPLYLLPEGITRLGLVIVLSWFSTITSIILIGTEKSEINLLINIKNNFINYALKWVR
jgi:O-antigen/teichoic acid export membrane protein